MAQGHVALGVAAAMAAACCFDGAVVLQAQEARAVPAAHALRLSLLRRLATRPRWVLGMVLALVGWPLQLAAFALAPITVVQPTLALGLLVLLIGGSRILHERVGPAQWAAALAVVAGVAVVALAAPAHTDHVPALAAAAPVIAVLAVLAVAPLVLRLERAWPLIVGAGCAFALTAVTGKLLTVEHVAGAWGAVAIYALATAAAGGVGLLLDMTALQSFDATRVAPPMFVLETVIPVVLAPALFREPWSATAGGGLVVGAGVLLVLGGGAVLGASRPVAALEGQPAEREDPVGGRGARPVGGVRAPR